MQRTTSSLAIRPDPAVHAAIRLSCFFLLLSGGILLCLHHDHLLLSRLAQGSGSRLVDSPSVHPAWDLAIVSLLVLTFWCLAVIGGQLNRLRCVRDE